MWGAGIAFAVATGLAFAASAGPDLAAELPARNDASPRRLGELPEILLWMAGLGFVAFGAWRFVDRQRAARDREALHRHEERLRRIARAVTPATGPGFFADLAQNLAAATGADAVVVVEVEATDPDRARTLALWDGNPPAESLELAVTGTLFGASQDRKTQVHLAGVRQHLPADPILRRTGAEAGVCSPVITDDGRMAGFVAALFRHSLPSASSIEPVLEMVAGRIAAELDRRRAGEALQAIENRLRYVVEHSTNLFFVKTPDGHLQYVSEQSSAFLGCEPEQAREPWAVFLTDHPANARGLERTRLAVASGEVQPLHELELKTRDGRTLWVEVREAPVVRDGRTTAVVGSLTDITGRKRAEDKSQESEQRFRMLAEATFEGIALTDHGVFLDLNDQLAAMLGYAREELVGTPVLEVVDPSSRTEVSRALASERLEPYEHLALRKDGSIVPVEIRVRVTNVGGRKLRLTAVRDISDRKRTQAAWQEQERFVFAVTHNSPDYIVVYDLAERRAVYRNKEVLRSLGHPGLTGADLDLDTLRPLVHPDDTSKLEDHFTRMSRARDGVVIGCEYRLRMGTGAYAWFLARDTVFRRDDHGRVLQVMSVSQDITERKQADSALRESQARFAGIVSSAMDAIISVDEKQEIVLFNTAAEEMFGVSAEDMLGQPLAALMPERHREAHRHHVDHFGRTGLTNRSMGTLGLVNGRRANGEEFPIEASISQIEASGQKLFTVILRDVTERRQAEQTRVSLEARLRQAQKMEAIGQLAGGVAHDFNNLLTVILGNASFLVDDPGLSSESRELTRQVAEAAGRASNLTRQLLAFSRQQTMQVRRVHLNDLLGDVYKMLSRLIGEHIALQCSYGPELPWIEADPGMIEQVIVNLAVNARDAMPKGGRLTIATHTEIVSPAEARSDPEARSGRFVTLTVTDTGTGMDPSTRERLFEPFFTTKEVGKGTGLGLATVYGIVKQHNGWIDVVSEPDQGSTFRVFVPVCEAPAAAPTAPEPKQELPRGTETVLVVEDEEPVRKFATATLRRCGYHVLEAACGIDAVGVWENHDRIDLLLTDMVMPGGMSGRELAEDLTSRRPDLKVIYTTGYTRDMVGGDTGYLTNENYLPKPYTLTGVATAVRRRLDAR